MQTLFRLPVLIAFAAFLAAGAAYAKDKDKAPPPKEAVDGCGKMKSACKNAEATRNLLREQPPPSNKPSSAGSTSKTLRK